MLFILENIYYNIFQVVVVDAISLLHSLTPSLLVRHLAYVLKRIRALLLFLRMRMIKERSQAHKVKKIYIKRRPWKEARTLLFLLRSSLIPGGSHTGRKQRTEDEIYTRNIQMFSCLCYARAVKQSTKGNWDLIMLKFQKPRTGRKQRTEGEIYPRNMLC